MKFQNKLFPIVLTIALAGCSHQSADELVSSAKQKIELGQESEGSIELKNAIQQAPDNGQARFLLGKIYVERGAAAAAEKELGKALKLGFNKNEALPLLAKAYNLQYRNIEVVDLVNESPTLDPIAQTSMLLYQALAYFQLDKPAKAKQSINLAIDISAVSKFSKLASAYLAFNENKLDISLVKTDEILAQQPNFVEALLLKGQLAALTKDNVSAVASFEKYQKLLPDLISARVFLANSYIKNRQYEAAEQYLDQLLKVDGVLPFVNQLKGFVRFQAQDFEKAKFYTEVAIQNGLSTIPNRIIAGISSLQQKKYEQAYQHLSAISGELSVEHPIQKLLATVELKLGYNVEAAEKLTKLQGLTQDDIVLLSAASSQLIREGKKEAALALLEKSETLIFSDPVRIAQKGLMRLTLDDIDGITDLEQALTLIPDMSVANTVLARTYIKGGLFEQALKLANVWIEQSPDQVNGYIFAGVSYAKLNRKKDAELMYKKALQIDAGSPAANIYFADLAMKAEDLKQSLIFLKNTINVYPNYIPALRKYYVLKRETGKQEAGLELIKSAFIENQPNLNFRLLYARTLFAEKRYSETINILEEIVADDIERDSYWILLTEAYFKKEQFDKAIQVAQKWSAQKSNDSAPYIRLITLQEVNNNSKKSLKIAEDAQSKFPNDLDISLLVIYFNIATNDIATAELKWQLLPDEIKSSSPGQGLKGQILLQKNLAEEALPLLQKFYLYAPNYRNAFFVSKALKAKQKYNESISFLQKHQLQYGESLLGNLQIAELAIYAGNNSTAINQYRKALAEDKSNLKALNNLASLLMEEKDYSGALVYAKTAVELQPKYPVILDTYASVLYKNGNLKEAIKYFEKAYKANPKATYVALHYVEALISDKQTNVATEVIKSLTITDPSLQVELERLKKLI